MTPLNFETLKSQVPAIFTTSPSPKMSDRYTFVPTMDILGNFEQEGWQVYSAKQTGRSQFATHEIRLRNGELPAVGDSLIEAVIRNSHNASRLPIIQESLSKMENRELTMDEKVGFVKGAAAIRWKEGNMPSTMSIEEILNPLRDGDVGNSLWKVFNVVQEKMVRGGVGYRSGRGRLTSMRELKNISVVNNVNTKLWELAETYC